MRDLGSAIGVMVLAALGAGAVCGCGGSTTNSSTGDMAVNAGTCVPTMACTAADKDCLGLTSNKGLTKFGLRMSELDVTSPSVFASGILKSSLLGGVGLSLPACNLQGSGTFSWLLQLDTTAGTLKTGSAKPVTDPTMGYSFDDEMITQGATTFHVTPVSYNVTPDGSGNFAITTGQDLLIAAWLDPAGTQAVLLPLHQALFSMGTLSSNNDCIGSYNAAGLQPSNSCLPDDTHPQFIDGGKLGAFISLEDADAVIISSIQASLCAVFAGLSSANVTMQLDNMGNSTGVMVCTRDMNKKIIYQGGWCSTTNAAAANGCADALQFSASFAASSILING